MRLLDRYQRAVIVDSGHLTLIYECEAIPFIADEIATLNVTHDKSRFNRDDGSRAR